jgi:hypothetical protein
MAALSARRQAANTSFDPAGTGLVATNVQDAIEEVSAGGGGGSPAFLRRRYKIGNGVNGIMTGTVDDTQGALNLGAMQEIVDDADTNSAGVEMDHETVQIAGGPLIIRSSAGGLIWDSPTYATLSQRSNNVAVLQLGDTSNVCQNLRFSGINLHYLNDQSANTNANALVIYNQWKSSIGNIQVSSTTATPRPYRGIYIPGSQTVFSNRFYNWYVFRARYSLLHISNYGTGNTYDNIYLSGVGTSGTAQQVDFPFRWDYNGNQLHDSVFNQLNIEWCISNQLMRLSNIRGPVFNSLHIEQNQLSGANASVYYNSIGNQVINGCMFLDNWIQTANVSDSNPAIFRSFNDGMTLVDSYTHISNSASYINNPFYLFAQADNDGINSNPGMCTINHAQWAEGASGHAAIASNMRYDRNLGFTDMDGGVWPQRNLLRAKELSLGGVQSTIEGGVLRMQATTRIYGQEMGRKLIVQVSGTLSANIDVTLDNFMAPSGSRWDGAPVPDGTVVEFRRAGTHTNDCNIKNHAGTTIATMPNGSGTSRQYLVKSGGVWVVA